MNTKKILFLSLFLFSSLSFSKEHEEEISDLNQAKSCFSIESENTQISLKIEALKKEISQREAENNDLKYKINSELQKINLIDDENDSLRVKKSQMLKKYQSSVHKYKSMEKTIFDLKSNFNKQAELFNSNKTKLMKLKCQNQFSEEAIEKICLIDKSFPVICNKILSTYMKHLKD